LDGVKPAVLLLVVLVAAACGSGGRARPLLRGGSAQAFGAVRGSALTAARVLRRASLGTRLESCLLRGDRTSVPADAPVVERVGVDGESLTFADSTGSGIYACDGGLDPAGERPLPWCGRVFGERDHGRLLDPRLDVNCRDRRGRAVAYAFVEPVADARWIGVQQKGYLEVYEALAGLPVRVATAEAVEVEEARATFEITEYDAAGHELVQREIQARVAG